MSVMEARVSWEAITLQLRNPFRVSYGVSATRQALVLRLANGEGWGEGTIPPYYGIGEEEITAVFQTYSRSPTPFPDDPSAISDWVGEEGVAPARCAMDMALHDRIGRLRQQPLYKLLNLPQPVPMPTSYTISLDTPERMAEMARQIPRYPVIKVKLGGDDDVACIAAIRAARPDVKLRVDANAAWSTAEAIRRIKALMPYNLEMVEQPTPVTDIDGMGEVQAQVNVPIVADESVQTLQNVEQLAAAGVQGVNLKLMKVGGIAPGLKMLHRARELGMRVMLGCMVETSLGVTAVSHLSALADWIDLDAPLLIANDPFIGVKYDEQNNVYLPSRPGIGVRRHEEE